MGGVPASAVCGSRSRPWSAWSLTGSAKQKSSTAYPDLEPGTSSRPSATQPRRCESASSPSPLPLRFLIDNALSPVVAAATERRRPRRLTRPRLRHAGRKRRADLRTRAPGTTRARLRRHRLRHPARPPQRTLPLGRALSARQHNGVQKHNRHSCSPTSQRSSPTSPSAASSSSTPVGSGSGGSH